MDIIDDYDKVTCRICGSRVLRIYGKHLKFKHGGITTDEYKLKFPGAPLMSPKDLESTNKNSGLHMKQEKYKKMFSEKILGEKNPSHRSKVDETERKRRSPFSKNFKGYDGVEDKESAVLEFTKRTLKDRLTTSQKEYWIQKGFSEDESILMVSNRQKTFSLEKCIEKYGEVDGKKRWLDRQEKWLSNYKKVNYSKISQELFISVYNSLIESGFKHRVYFAKLDNNGLIHNTNKNYEYRLRLNDSYILPDFYIPTIKFIVEFDGTYYHRNNIENKKREMLRDDSITKAGYNIIHIKESDYIKDKPKTVEDLVNLIRTYEIPSQ